MTIPILNLIHYYNILCMIFIYLIEDIFKKTLAGSNIILYKFYDSFYDYKSNIHILYLSHNIEMHTIQDIKTKERIIYIYHNKVLKSSVKLIAEKNKNYKNKVILTVYYIDKYYLLHIIIIYSYGIISHQTNFFMHHYNYIGEKRIIYSIV